GGQWNAGLPSHRGRSDYKVAENESSCGSQRRLLLEASRLGASGSEPLRVERTLRWRDFSSPRITRGARVSAIADRVRGGLRCVEHVADLARQALERERLLQESRVSFAHAVPQDSIVGVAGDVEH